MGPFGPENMTPVFVTENVYVDRKPRILKESHLKMFLKQEGYGISPASIRWAAKNGFTLVVSLDCGIKAVNLIKEAKDKGIVDFLSILYQFLLILAQ